MKNLIIFLTGFLVLSGCGVKGKPLPPIEAPMIGRGEPSFTDAASEIDMKKKKIKKNKDDWNESKDFNEPSEKGLEK